jgi:hypothetical protein
MDQQQYQTRRFTSSHAQAGLNSESYFLLTAEDML